MTGLEPMPEDWDRALVLMAHPDDPEYGAAAAVAEWTSRGKQVSYLLATRGEAGIAGLPPAAAGPVREAEQRAACAAVGVDTLSFLGYPDGRLEESLALRRDLARGIRQYRPDGIITLNHRESWGPGRWNSQDHQVLGRAVLNAVADAASEWIFPELADDGLAPHAGVRWVAVVSPQPTHSVQVGADSWQRALASLMAHERYLQSLSARPVRDQALEQLRLVTGGDDGGRVAFELFRT
ncbi:PIG-L family deacetylase [Arthrobacter sp. I2-34]|uniref:PIG-L family deacetylase n=1 Tax=Arthrobacter hankyongi TaxID=2904801 RepID=A0ABS9L6C9_9MICC|nr:PIG-L family deacetylase [Arthrobacter hankyongi]MCG2622042.1 PIG-L family deacetylase [Arthrobacter hankyongi]